MDNIHIDHKRRTLDVFFTPTIPHCSMATLIGLCIRVKLLRSLPPRFKVWKVSRFSPMDRCFHADRRWLAADSSQSNSGDACIGGCCEQTVKRQRKSCSCTRKYTFA
eukprot:gb/GECG01002775.1/.p1 GENE.gb/GECG01002775.1/~~gb/GECG01002775.1/.p1  ORF type:complete len:107 (+),score=3.85 gb/GECG01002775.1/:1-321(+)